MAYGVTHTTEHRAHIHSFDPSRGHATRATVTLTLDETGRDARRLISEALADYDRGYRIVGGPGKPLRNHGGREFTYGLSSQLINPVCDTCETPLRNPVETQCPEHGGGQYA
jgi:hypothetical protein